MKVSVVIPVYNSAATLQRAVDSVLAQTMTDWELLLVDNNSTDGGITSLLPCGPAHRSRIHITREPKQGASAARNHGLRLARGEWLQFLDADDELAPDKLAHQLEIAGEADWIMAAYRLDDPTGYVHLNLPHEDPWKGLVHGYRTGYTSANLYRRRVLLSLGGWDETLPDNEDPELSFRLLRAGATYILDQRLLTFYHHQGPGGLSVIDRVGGSTRRVQLLAKVNAFLRHARPDYWRTNAPYFRGALLAALRVLATYDLRAARRLAAELELERVGHLPHNPKYTRLYRWLGFGATERLRNELANHLPNGLKLWL